MRATSARLCPDHGLVLAELAVLGTSTTATVLLTRTSRRESRLGWRCSACFGAADELPEFARPHPRDGLTSDPDAWGRDMPSSRRLAGHRMELGARANAG